MTAEYAEPQIPFEVRLRGVNSAMSAAEYLQFVGDMAGRGITVEVVVQDEAEQQEEPHMLVGFADLQAFYEEIEDPRPGKNAVEVWNSLSAAVDSIADAKVLAPRLAEQPAHRLARVFDGRHLGHKDLELLASLPLSLAQPWREGGSARAIEQETLDLHTLYDTLKILLPINPSRGGILRKLSTPRLIQLARFVNTRLNPEEPLPVPEG